MNRDTTIVAILAIVLTAILLILIFTVGDRGLIHLPGGNNNSVTCNYDSPDKNYVKKDPSCKVVNFACLNGEQAFVDACGCGCRKINSGNSTSSDFNYCSSDSRNGSVCTAIYKPVCGWFNATKIQCIKFPCAQTFSNSCAACHNTDVSYWTEGECPK